MELDAYRTRLLHHDWSWRNSDCHSTCKDGRRDEEEIIALSNTSSDHLRSYTDYKKFIDRHYDRNNDWSKAPKPWWAGEDVGLWYWKFSRLPIVRESLEKMVINIATIERGVMDWKLRSTYWVGPRHHVAKQPWIPEKTLPIPHEMEAAVKEITRLVRVIMEAAKWANVYLDGKDGRWSFRDLYGHELHKAGLYKLDVANGWIVLMMRFYAEWV